MKRRIVGGCLAAALAMTALAAPALADAPINDHDCVGKFASEFKDSMGSWGRSFKSGMADYQLGLLDECGDAE